MVHGMKHPDDRERKVIRKDVEEEKRGEMTLRRTTIEEIEFKKKSDDHGS